VQDNAEPPAAAAPESGGKGWWTAGLMLGGLVLAVAAAAAIVLGRRFVGRPARAARVPGRPAAPGGRGVITFACSQCAKSLKARTDLVGKKIKCPGCGSVVVVPAAAAD
jgi:hypothetical protein